MITFPIFSNFLIIDTLSIDNEKLKNFCYELKGNDIGRAVSNQGGWQSNNLSCNHPMLEELFANVTSIMYKTNSILKLHNNITHEITEVWLNINQKHDYNLRHNHGLAFLSGVYYVDADCDTGDIVFSNPDPKIEPTYCHANISLQSNIVSEYNEFNSITWSIPPETGKLIIFPGYIDHHVLANNTNKDRISISFNTRVIDNSNPG